jgi:hypothetical protein
MTASIKTHSAPAAIMPRARGGPRPSERQLSAQDDAKKTRWISSAAASVAAATISPASPRTLLSAPAVPCSTA